MTATMAMLAAMAPPALAPAAPQLAGAKQTPSLGGDAGFDGLLSALESTMPTVAPRVEAPLAIAPVASTRKQDAAAKERAVPSWMTMIADAHHAESELGFKLKQRRERASASGPKHDGQQRRRPGQQPGRTDAARAGGLGGGQKKRHGASSDAPESAAKKRRR